LLGKRINLNEFKTQARGGKGLIAIKFKEKAGGGIEFITLLSNKSSPFFL
jgi:DNA gyrase/topoisomerase IV subunit A